jgi:hypothetical protein
VRAAEQDAAEMTLQPCARFDVGYSAFRIGLWHDLKGEMPIVQNDLELRPNFQFYTIGRSVTDSHESSFCRKLQVRYQATQPKEIAGQF